MENLQRHYLNKRFFVLFTFTLLLFGLANLTSCFLRSDTTLPGANDAVHRVGFPFLVSETGGFDGRDVFHHVALWANIAIALCTGTVAAIIIKRLAK